MNYNIGNYDVLQHENGDLTIHYKRGIKDYLYIVVYFIIGIPILYFDYKLFSYLVFKKFSSNVFFGYFFAISLLLFGLYFLVVSIETLIKPTKKVFFINRSTKQLKIKLNLFKNLHFDFSEMKRFKARAKNITVKTFKDGRTYKRPLYLIHLEVELIDSKVVNIHQFEGQNLILSLNENKKNKSLKDVAKHIARLISDECGKEFEWKGTTKE